MLNRHSAEPTLSERENFRWKQFGACSFLAFHNVEQSDERDRLSIGLRLKSGSISANILPDDVLFELRISAKKFRNVISELDPNLFVISAYGSIPTKSILKGLISKASVVGRHMTVSCSIIRY